MRVIVIVATLIQENALIVAFFSVIMNLRVDLCLKLYYSITHMMLYRSMGRLGPISNARTFPPFAALARFSVVSPEQIR